MSTEHGAFAPPHRGTCARRQRFSRRCWWLVDCSRASQIERSARLSNSESGRNISLETFWVILIYMDPDDYATVLITLSHNSETVKWALVDVECPSFGLAIVLVLLVRFPPLLDSFSTPAVAVRQRYHCDTPPPATSLTPLSYAVRPGQHSGPPTESHTRPSCGPVPETRLWATTRQLLSIVTDSRLPPVVTVIERCSGIGVDQ
jgi:hypothetical protein